MIFLLVLLAALGVVARLSWNEVLSWLRGIDTVACADLVRTALDNDDVQIFSIGLAADGTQLACRTWRAAQLDAQLANQFADGEEIRITI